MLPLRLELHNFLAYRDPQPLRFDGIHLACLTGANGAGKSSLLDAITWALWGEARTSRDNDLVHLGQTDMSVQLEFEQDGHIYRVMRKRSRKGNGTTQLNLYAVLDDGTPNNLTESSIKATQAAINRKLRMTYRTFVNSAFLQQGKADAFTVMAPRERKDVLGEMLELKRWDKYEEAAKAVSSRYEIEIAGDKAELDRITRELVNLPRLQEDRERAQATYEQSKTLLDAAQALLDEVINAPVELKAAQDRLSTLERRVFNARNDLTTAQAQAEDAARKIADYQAVLTDETAIAAGYAALQRAREADQELGRKLGQIADVDRQRSALEKTVAAARAELDKTISRAESALVQLNKRIAAADRETYAQVQAELRELGDPEAEREELQNAIRRMEGERGALKAENTAMIAEADERKQRIAQLNKADGAICPTCGQPLDEEHRQHTLQLLQEETEQKRMKYRSNDAVAKTLDNQITQSSTQMTALVNRQAQKSRLDKREAALGQAIADADQALIDAAQAESERDAARHMLDAGDYAAEARQQLAELNAQRDTLAYNEAEHAAARADLRQFADYEKRHNALDLARQMLPELERSRDNAAARAERIAAELAEDETLIGVTHEQIGALTGRVQQKNQREQERNTLLTQTNTARERLLLLEQELHILEIQQVNRDRIAARLDANRQEMSLYDDLRFAFSKRGVPAWIIEAAIPELESSANRLLNRMSDGRMQLRLITQREKVTGEGAIETLDIQVSDELGTRDYNLFSGGEAFRINFALRVALSQLLARRSGAQLQTLFVDEGFGTQDEDGRNKLVEAITAIQEDFDLILVITHIEDLRDSFPVHIAIEKTADGSKVALR